MLKKALLVLLALVVMPVLFLVPILTRRSFYYTGQFKAREIPRPDLNTIAVRPPDMPAFEDRFSPPAAGTILVDVAHENRFEMAELSVLQARLSARGQRVEAVESAWDLPGKLRYAKALVVISPGETFDPDEIRQIEDFVDKGGRLLLITDPTRFGLHFDEYGYLIGLDSDAMYVNDLAARFGLVFQSDYLYNTVEHEGNYRNIKLTELAADGLTAGVKQLVFYATHSIRADQPALITATGETRSSSSERADELAVAVLTAGGRVLALGDITFMTEPQNVVYDNDLFIANIADWLGGAARRYELVDFPFFFADAVDLVYVDAPLLDTDFLAASSALQRYFTNVGKELTIRAQEDPARDTLFLGVYDHTQDVGDYLEALGVSMLFSRTVTLEPTATPAPTPTVEPTPVLTPLLEITPTPTATLALTEELELPPLAGELVSPTVTETEALTATGPISPLVSRVEIEPLGQMVVTGTALLALQSDGERRVMVVLAHTEGGLESAVERLTYGSLYDCVLLEVQTTPIVALALCPTDEVEQGAGAGGWDTSPWAATPTPTPAPPETRGPGAGAAGDIILIAPDDGHGVYDSLTGAEDFADILDDRYNVTLWYKSRHGTPTAEDIADYDMLIWAAGDFEGTLYEEMGDLVFGAVMGGQPVLMSGGYLGETTERAVQRDIQVHDDTHPLARGFEPGQVISFVPSPSWREYEINVEELDEEQAGATLVYVRGPDSEASGSASIVTLEEALSDVRLVVIGFPIYLLPQDAKELLVKNAAEWLLTGGE